jgi:Amt family ammonium transporter
VQAIGVVAVGLFSGIATYVIAKIADMLVGLRVDREHETVGLDFASHGETGYHNNR